MDIIKSNWENILKIVTLIATVATVVFAYLSIRTSRKIASEQIQFNENIHNQEIKMGRPMISCTGNISIFDSKIYNLNVAIKNIGKRTLYNLTIKYWALGKESNDAEVVFHEEYSIANQVDSGVEQIFFERLPRAGAKKILYYKINLDYTDSLTNTKYTQDFYFIFPIEQQFYLESKEKETIGLFGAAASDKEFINKNIN